MNMISLFVVTVLASASVLLMSACGTSCTAMEPRCELVVALDHLGWEPGTYVFEAEGGGEIESCTVTLPLEDEGSGLPCLNRRFPFGEPTVTDGYPSRLIVREPPMKVEVRIFYENTLVANKKFEPRYDVTEPNGEGCGVCLNAEVAMDF